jgi:hypothetical protein
MPAMGDNASHAGGVLRDMDAAPCVTEETLGGAAAPSAWMLGGGDAGAGLTLAGPEAAGRAPWAAPVPPAGRVGVVVLGMHRSGTSATARLLNLLGCSLPATLMPARQGNAPGHWESEAICALDDALLDSAGSHWADWRGLNRAWYAAPGYEHWVARGRQVLRDEFGDAALFVMKDPRQCRLGRFWFDVLAREGVSPRVILTLRHPWEVAQSLARRDGMGPARAHLLWLAHMLEAEAASRGTRRVVQRLDQAMGQGPAGLEAMARAMATGLAVAWPRLSADVLAQMAAFLDPAAWHHAAGRDGEVDETLSGWAGRVHAILARWAQGGEDTADHAELDAIAAGLHRAEGDLARLVHRCEGLESLVAAQGQAAEEQAGQADAALAQARDELAQARGALAGALEWLAEERTAGAAQGEALAAARQAGAQAQADLARAEAGVLDLTALRDALVRERVGLVDQVDALEQACAAGEARESALAWRAAAGDTALASARREAGAAMAALDGALVRLGQRETDLALGAREQARLAEALANAEDWVWRLAGERRALEQALAGQGRRLAAVTRDRDQARRGADEKDTLLARERVALAQARAAAVEQGEAQARIARMETAWAAMAQQRDEQAARLATQEQALAQARQAQERSEQDLAERYAEIAALTTMLRESEDQARVHAVQAAWMRDLWAAWRRMPAWWGCLPGVLARRWREGRLARRGLFDARAYRAAYADVTARGFDPLGHYIAHGMGEGRRALAGEEA